MTFRIIFLCTTVLLFFSCSEVEDKITVYNPSESNFEGIVEVPLSKIKKPEANNVYWIKNGEGEIIPSQLTYDSLLIFQASIKPDEKQVFTIGQGEVTTYNTLVSGRHYPERYGDFAWENDKVGFRFYGKELKAIQAPTSGLDLFYKRTDKIILDEWYAKDISGEASYHEDHGEGCDPYAVGQTLGGGSMAILTGDTLHLNDNFESFEVLDKGALRITFKLNYPSIVVDGKTIGESKTISLDAGCQLTKIVQEYKTSEPLTVVAGFPKRQSGDSISHQENKNYFIYQEPANEKNGQIFLGIVMPKGIDNVSVCSNTNPSNANKPLTTLPNVVATTQYTPNEPITYYTGFGWSKSGFSSLEDFDKYLFDFSATLSTPLHITYR